MMYSNSDDSEEPRVSEHSSRGSSVSLSADLQQEYDELLKYALIAPGWQNTSKETHMPQQLRLAKPDKGCSKSNASEVDYSEMGSAAMLNFFMEKQKLNETHRDDEHAPIEHQCPLNCDDSFRNQFEEQQSQSVIVEKLESHYLEMQCAFKDFLSHSSIGRDRLILEKVAEMKDSLVRRFLFAMQERDEVHQKQIQVLQGNLEQNINLTKTLDESLARKDRIIEKLMQNITKLKEKVDLAKSLSLWKSDIADKKRLEFCDNLAQKHRDRQLLSTALRRWHNCVRNRWKKRIEKSCQTKADDTIQIIVEEYETKISKNVGIHAVYEKEIERLQTEMERMTHGMQKAFKRGVCALNYEARTVLTDPVGDTGDDGCCGRIQVQPTVPDCQYAATVQHNNGDLPFSYHRKEVVRQGVSHVNEPILTTTTQRKHTTTTTTSQQPASTQRKQSTTTTTSRQPRLVKGRPQTAGTINNDGMCTACPNQETHPCQDVYTGLKPRGMTGRYVKAAQLLPVPRHENRPKNSPHPILVERHTPNVEHAAAGRTLTHVQEYRNTTVPTIPPSATANSSSYHKTACYTIGRSLPNK